MIVDCQWHWHPPALIDLHLGRTDYLRATRTEEGYLYEVSEDEIWKYDARYTDLDFQVKVLDSSGIDVAVVSASIAGDLSDRDHAEAAELCTVLNEEMHRAEVTYPDRFIGLAHLPFGDVNAAMKVLDDATSRLKLSGIMVPGNVAGETIATERLYPLYEMVEDLGVPLLLHPTRAFRSPKALPYRMEVSLGYMFDTSFAMMGLIVGGVLDRFPNLKVVHPHAGGTLPYLHGRLEVYRTKGWWPDMKRSFREYLQTLYYDTVCNEPETLELLMKVIPAEQILFSTDFPYFSSRKALEFVRANVPVEHLSGVLGENALRLFGRSENLERFNER
ncbi:amidohydrolase family protein [Mycolicibacterium phlei]|uniref:amidohydrolase family protein n=1 Tax=Mycolicibacterium phlei TaxID=1771 RepID=UPI0037CCB78E